jgi:hypothetical protein
VDITSIKRKKATLDAMANVLNEFLHGVSKGFQDAAFASFSRRRSTVREDINQSFSGGMDEPQEAPIEAPGQAYLDMLNVDDEAPEGIEDDISDDVPALDAPEKKARAKAGVVDEKPGKRGRKSGGRGSNPIREV